MDRMKFVPHLIGGILMWANVLSNDARGEAIFFSGNDLLKMCAGPERIGCHAYVAGVEDAIVSERADEGKSSCLPHSLQIGQAVGVTLNYLISHPETRDFSAAFLIREAITVAWRC